MKCLNGKKNGVAKVYALGVGFGIEHLSKGTVGYKNVLES